MAPANNCDVECNGFGNCQHRFVFDKLDALFTFLETPYDPLEACYFGTCLLSTFTGNPWFRVAYFTEVLNSEIPSSVNLENFMEFFNANLGRAYP